jgi:predicted AAA+ superfamily ATPase
MFSRRQRFEGAGQESLFLWGARQTGKSTLLKSMFPDALWFDLLRSDVYRRYLTEPMQFREAVLADTAERLVVVDEIQKVPALLDEIHWLMEHQGRRFIMSGSSPRKIIRQGANLLGGRAIRYELFPLVSAEIPGFDLMRALNNGLLPRHYLSERPRKLLEAYIGNYLQDEIVAEARIRNIAAFSQFLRAAAFSNGEMVNYSGIGSDCGVSHNTVREYFQILEDTLIGRFVPSFQKRPKRRVILTPKFYYVDLGLVNILLGRGRIERGTESMGNAFEHFIAQELHAHASYAEESYQMAFWRTTSQLEVDFVLGDHEVAVEVKSTDNIQPRHLKGLKAFAEEYTVKRLIAVSTDPVERMVGGVSVLPWQVFLKRLWGGEII